MSGRMVHSYSKINSLCRKYGLLAGRGGVEGEVEVWGGSGHMDVIGIILTSEDWGVIERCVVELAMTQSFGV